MTFDMLQFHEFFSHQNVKKEFPRRNVYVSLVSMSKINNNLITSFDIQQSHEIFEKASNDARPFHEFFPSK